MVLVPSLILKWQNVYLLDSILCVYYLVVNRKAPCGSDALSNSKRLHVFGAHAW